MSETLALYLSAPVASFRVPQAREYLETLPCPPPSTIYGALLSLVGETSRAHHTGVEIAIATLTQPRRSVVLRTVWRVKDARGSPGVGENKRPDFQELLTNVQVAVWVRPGAAEQAVPSLAERLSQALATPESVERFGGLALGESTHLVNEVAVLRPAPEQRAHFLAVASDGPLTLPVWPDHVGSAGTTWVSCRLEERPLRLEPDEDCWIRVAPSAA